MAQNCECYTLEPEQYLSIVYSERPAAEGAVTSVGSRGSSYDNSLVESVIGLYKRQLIFNRGPWRTVEDVELAALAWVHWWNTTRCTRRSAPAAAACRV